MRLLNKIKAERITPEDSSTAPFFHQQQKVYSYCEKYVKNKTTLELGSGSGYGAYYLSKYARKLIALDKDYESIKDSKINYKSKNLLFIHEAIEKYKNNEKFDVIILLQVIEHLANVDSLFTKILSLLEKDGVVILSTPNAPMQSYNENPYHYKEYNARELNRLLSLYFKRITIYGLHGNKDVREYEKRRREQVLSVLEKDRMNIRRFIPRVIKQYLFDIFSFSRKHITRVYKTKLDSNITEKSYTISKNNLNRSIDLIAVCQSIK